MLVWMRWHFSALNAVALYSETKSLPTLDSRSKRKLPRMPNSEPFTGRRRPVVLIPARVATLALFTSTDGCPIRRMDQRSLSSSTTARSKSFQDFILAPAVANRLAPATFAFGSLGLGKAPCSFTLINPPNPSPLASPFSAC